MILLEMVHEWPAGVVCAFCYIVRYHSPQAPCIWFCENDNYRYTWKSYVTTPIRSIAYLLYSYRCEPPVNQGYGRIVVPPLPKVNWLTLLSNLDVIVPA